MGDAKGLLLLFPAQLQLTPIHPPQNTNPSKPTLPWWNLHFFSRLDSFQPFCNTPAPILEHEVTSRTHCGGSSPPTHCAPSSIPLLSPHCCVQESSMPPSR